MVLQSTPGEEFRWVNTKMNERTQRILNSVISVVMIITIVLAHTPVLASIRHSSLYFWLYFYLAIIIVNGMFARNLLIVINREGVRVRMPQLGGQGGGALPSLFRTVSFELSWDEIQQVRITARRVIVTTRDQDDQEFSLFYLNFRATRKLKSMLRSLAESRGITIRAE